MMAKMTVAAATVAALLSASIGALAAPIPAAITAATTVDGAVDTVEGSALVAKKRAARGVFNKDWVGDGYCDKTGGYNTAEHEFDGGDCCPTKFRLTVWPAFKIDGCKSGPLFTCGVNGYQCIDPRDLVDFEGMWLAEESFTCPYEKRVHSELFLHDVWPKTDACRDPNLVALQGIIFPTGKAASNVIIKQSDHGGSAGCVYYNVNDCQLGSAYKFPIEDGDAVTENKWFVPPLSGTAYYFLKFRNQP